MGKFEGKSIIVNNKTYTLTELIGQGGNAEVWKAKNDCEKYAVKILINNQKKKMRRFNKEIEFCRTQEHDNLIRIIDSGTLQEDKESYIYYVMPEYEYDLARYLKKMNEYKSGGEDCDNVLKVKRSEDDYSPEIKIDYLIQMCQGIEFLHVNNVIHRDLKPDNILIDNNKIVISDLGIAHFEDSNETKENEWLGNRWYAAPEQKIKGLSKKVTKAVDIFALGVMINEIFTGKPPDGSNFTLISEEFPWLIDLDKLVEACRTQDSSKRPKINEVIYKLKNIDKQHKNEMKLIEKRLERELKEEKREYSEVHEQVIKRAVYDILIAKYLFQRVFTELKDYNPNFHCNIQYRLRGNLLNIYIEKLLELKIKRIKSNPYYNASSNIYLTHCDMQERKEYEDQFRRDLGKHNIDNEELIKAFSSLAIRHCIDIIKELDGIIEKANKLLNPAPILMIVMSYKEYELVGIDIANDIQIDWDETFDFENLYSESGTLKKYRTSIEKEQEKALESFKDIFHAFIDNHYNIDESGKYDSKDDKYYSVTFESKKYYDQFCQCIITALEKDENEFCGIDGLVNLDSTKDEYCVKPWNSWANEKIRKLMNLVKQGEFNDILNN